MSQDATVDGFYALMDGDSHWGIHSARNGSGPGTGPEPGGQKSLEGISPFRASAYRNADARKIFALCPALTTTRLLVSLASSIDREPRRP